tara:strand:- start:629 stop:1369 length:741 start_codon:yes stop_codon:yes gene_type:complete
MARISTYPVDQNPDGSDILLGTDSSGGTDATKNFRISDISLIVINDFLANSNWKFNIDATEGENQRANIFFAAGGGDNTSWSNITTLRATLFMANGTNAQPYLQYLLTNDPVTGQPAVDNVIKITDRNDLSSFGVYTFTSLTLVSNVTGMHIYDIGLAFKKGAGAIQSKHIYGINIDPSDNDDKTFIYEQVTPATTWNVPHNLAKFPAITVIDTANTVVTGQYTYIDNNNVTLTFSAAFAGKAYQH